MTCTALTPRSSRKRENILTAALDLFLQDGFAATSMDGVAAQAGVSKATIYAHFASKAELFAAVIRNNCEKNFVDIEAFETQGLDARQALTEMSKHIIEVINTDMVLGLHRVVVAEAIRYPELAQGFWEAGPGYACPVMAQFFIDLDQRGLLRVPNPAMAANMMVAMLKSEVFFRNLLGLPAGDGPITPEATVAATVDMLMAAYGV